MDTSIYKVKSGNFEGPLELLLTLIEERKLFVNEVSIAQVTDDYIKFVQNINHESTDKRIADISGFIIVAATLILIKSKSLLPNLALTEDEEEKIENLETRLKLYQIIKKASIDVSTQFGAHIIFTAPERNWSDPIWSPDVKMTLPNMTLSIESVLAHIPKKQAPLPEIEVKKVVSIEEMINSLTERIQESINTSFKDFSKAPNGADEREVKVTIIVSFLAMLELVREGLIDVIQNNKFEDITMQTLPKE